MRFLHQCREDQFLLELLLKGFLTILWHHQLALQRCSWGSLWILPFMVNNLLWVSQCCRNNLRRLQILNSSRAICLWRENLRKHHWPGLMNFVAPKEGAKLQAAAMKKAEKVVNPLFEKRPKQFGIGGALPPKKELRRYVKCPQVVRIQRKSMILKQRLKVPPPMHQFSKTLSKNLGLRVKLKRKNVF